MFGRRCQNVSENHKINIKVKQNFFIFIIIYKTVTFINSHRLQKKASSDARFRKCKERNACNESK